MIYETQKRDYGGKVGADCCKLLPGQGILREIISISSVTEGVAQVLSSRGKKQDEIIDARVGITTAQ